MSHRQERILVIEDSESFQVMIETTLQPLGYAIDVAESGKRARELLSKHEYQLIVLDVGLPDVNGFELCAEIQAMPASKVIPIVFLTGKTDVTDKVTAFALGADDYVVKPFQPLELRARIDAKLKRRKKNGESETHFTVGNLEIQLAMHRAYVIEAGGVRRELTLTPLDFKLLYHLARKPEQVFTREQLLADVWGTTVHVYDRTVDAHIYSLRKQLGPLAHYIESVVNVGYKFQVPRSN